MTVNRLPALTSETRAFWTSGERGALEICRCKQCARWIHPPQPICAPCLSFDVQPQPVSGRGRVMSFTINEQAWVPGQQVPFVFAVIELEEQVGLWVMSRIVGCSPEQVEIGMPVRVRFEHVEDVWLPLFEPECGNV